jgi:hypothetical protein
MVAREEHCQLRAAIEVLVPYSSAADVEKLRSNATRAAFT